MLKLLFAVVVFSLATYLVVRAFQQRGVVPARPARPTRPAPRRVVAPDDDEDFLRDLDRKRLDPGDPEA